jgi:3-phosphoshikimate 1-carboxyvinyltransferase
VDVEESEDGLIIRGRDELGGGTVDSFTDHRIAMAFSIAGLRAGASVTVLNTGNVATSFPDFEARARELGLGLAATERS